MRDLRRSPAFFRSLVFGLGQDLRYALRLLRRDRVYAAVAILTMALGIGATTTLFSVAYGVLMKPLPWSDANRIMRIVETRDGHQARLPETMTNGTYLSWRDHPTTAEAIGGYGVGTQSMTAARAGQSEPIRLRVTSVTPSAFDVLRAAPLRGLIFTDSEVPPAGLGSVDAPRPVVISHALWEDWFAGRDDALGTVMRLDDVPYTIVGVMPAWFAFPDAETRAWAPLSVPQVLQPNNARSMMI